MGDVASKTALESVVEIAKLIQDPVLILLFIAFFFFMLLVFAEKREKKTLVGEVINDLADQVELMADEIKTMGESLMQLTILLKTIAMSAGKGVEDENKKESGVRRSAKTESKKSQS